MKKGKYLITGCAGFIGSNLVKNLYKNYELILVDDLSEGSLTNLPDVLRKKLTKKKIQNIEKLNTNKLDGIFHLAAQASVPLSLKEFYRSTANNLSSSIRVFELSKKYSAPVVYASSSAIYGNLPLGNDEIKLQKMELNKDDLETAKEYENFLNTFFEESNYIGSKTVNPESKNNGSFDRLRNKVKTLESEKRTHKSWISKSQNT